MKYICGASGERVIKSHGDGQAIYVNGFPMGGSGTVGNYTVYVNPYMVFQNFKYTKHFYIEGQRIVSKLGEMGVEQELLLPKSHAGDSLKNPVKWDSKKELSKDIIIANFEALGLSGAVFTAGKSGKVPYGQIKKYYRNADVVINPGTTTTSGKKTEDLQFYYHPDHLGSSSYITDVSGEVYQHMEYLPFGETFIEERNDAEYTNYLYNGKELDEETGLYYYGARYYDARISLWYGVDLLADKHPQFSSYAYAANNPIKYIDPDGNDYIVAMETDKNGKTQIRISATYYVKNGDKNSLNAATAATKHWNNQSGKYALRTQNKDGSSANYKIVFDLAVKVVIDPQAEQKKDITGDKGALTPSGGSNIFSIVNDTDIGTPGVCSGLNNIKVRESKKDDPQVAAHEIGHSFGLPDEGTSSWSIMNGGNTGETSVSGDNILGILKFAEKYKTPRRVSIVGGSIPQGDSPKKRIQRKVISEL